MELHNKIENTLVTRPSGSKQENLYLKRMWSRNLVGKRVARAGLISGPITTFSVFPVGPEASFTVGLVSIVSDYQTHTSTRWI